MMICRVEHNRRRLRMQVHVCESRFERGRGLLARRRPDHETAFLLRDCRAVHTVGLTYAIDVVFCDARGRIVRIDADSVAARAAVASGEPFRTDGCPGNDGSPACNRPFGSYRPGEPFRDYPFPPDAGDLRRIERELRLDEILVGAPQAPSWCGPSAVALRGAS